MKNFSASSNWTTIEKENEEVDVVEIDESDERVFLSYKLNGVSYFFTSDGKPLIFKNEDAAKEYIEKNNLENHEIDQFINFDFTDIEIIEI